MIGHLRHGSPPRLLALPSILSPNRRESLPTPSAGVRMTGCFIPQTGMNEDNATYPSTRTISPSERTGGHFDWAIRRLGTLVERSDRPCPSERSARESGQAAVERQLRVDREPKR